MKVFADVLLVFISSVSAAWLARHKNLEPDYTWLEVVIGVLVCLSQAEARFRLGPPTAHAYRMAVIRAFCLAAPPIVIGEVAQKLQRDDNTRQVLAAVAQKRDARNRT